LTDLLRCIKLFCEELKNGEKQTITPLKEGCGLQGPVLHSFLQLIFVAVL
jgi:hypothetical protein